MRTEIGSEFFCVPVGKENHMFPEETQWFCSGRSALYAILKENNFKTALLPDWCCDSMIKPFLDCGIKVEFYPALSGFSKMEADVVLVMDYFGVKGSSPCGTFSGIVIRDMTHSVLNEMLYNDADYYFGSLRKWAGFYTGGFAWGLKSVVSYESESTEYIHLRKTAMEKKRAYLYEETNDKSYLDIFSAAEELLEKEGVFPAATEDVARAKMLDVSFIRERRRKNASILLDAFSEIAVFPESAKEDCPLFVPIRVPDRDALRKYLIEQEIYCPVHWPKTPYHRVSEETQNLYENGLSLVCDQRYTDEDMYRIVRAIKTFLERGV